MAQAHWQGHSGIGTIMMVLFALAQWHEYDGTNHDVTGTGTWHGHRSNCTGTMAQARSYRHDGTGTRTIALARWHGHNPTGTKAQGREQLHWHDGTGTITRKIALAQWHRHDSTVTMGTRMIALARSRWHGHRLFHNNTCTHTHSRVVL